MMVSFLIFKEYMHSLEARNKRLKLRKSSLRADMLKERNKSSGLKFRYLMQGDFILFMRAEIENKDWYYFKWWPETLPYLSGFHFTFHSAFEVFARSVSTAYFNKVKCLLAIDKKEDLAEFLENYRTRKRDLPKWNMNSVNPYDLLGFKELATKP